MTVAAHSRERVRCVAGKVPATSLAKEVTAWRFAGAANTSWMHGSQIAVLMREGQGESCIGNLVWF